MLDEKFENISDFKHENTSEKTITIKIPKNKSENREFKKGFQDDNNEDIAYINVALVWPIGISAIISLFFFILSCLTMESVTHLNYERFALNQILLNFGKTYRFCNNTYLYEDDLWPSFLRQKEFKVTTNVFFRIAVCVPMIVRIFGAFVLRNSNREIQIVQKNLLLNTINEIFVVFSTMEFISLSLFSIITIRFDFPKFYNLMLGLFIFSTIVHMFLKTLLTVVTEQIKAVEQIVLITRLLCTVFFTWTSSQVYQTHQNFISELGCHGYVTPQNAFTEYVAIVSYILFSLTTFNDVKNIRFICYPRTCSGECEPVNPKNFSKDGKFAYCRAYELQQRYNFMNYEKTDKTIKKNEKILKF